MFGSLPAAVVRAGKVVAAVLTAVVMAGFAVAYWPAGAGAASAPSGTAASAGLVEVVDARTRTSRTWQRPDGGMTTQLSSVAVNYRDDTGAWKPIDSELVPGSGSSLENAANKYELRLPDSLEDPVTVSEGSASVSFELRGAEGERSSRGSSATFADALPGVDVVYEAGAEAVKEELVLAGPESQRVFEFDMDLSAGLEPRLNDAGGVDLVDGGETVGSVLPPSMVDAAGERSTDVEYRVRENGSRWVLMVDADGEWLADPAREWAVTIDPPVTFSEAYDTYIASGSDPPNGADAQYGPTTWFEVTTGGTRLRRSLLKFNASGIPDNAVIGGATMKLFGRGTNQIVDAHRLTRGFTTSATWNKHDGATAWTTPGGDFEATRESTATVAAEGWYSFTVGNPVADWVADGTTNHGILLKARTESIGSNGQGADFNSALSGGNYPYIEVSWETATGVKPFYGLDTIELSDRSKLDVNLANGNLIYTSNDVNVKGKGGMDLTVDRTYNVQSGWAPHGEDLSLSVGESVFYSNYNGGRSCILRLPGMTPYRFARNPDDSWKTPAGLNATLTDVTGGRELLFHRTGEKWFFDSAKGYSLSWRENKNGHRITYGLDSAGKITSITDSQNRSYTISRGSNGLVSSITDPAYPSSSRVWDYDFTASSQGELLTTYTDPAGHATQYAYHPGTTDLSTITDGRGNQVSITYTYAYDNGMPRVASITRKTASTTDIDPKRSYAYDLTARKTTITDENGNATSGDPNDGKWQHFYNRKLEVTKVTDPKGYDSTTSRNSNGDSTQLVGQAQSGSGITPATVDLTYSSDGNNNPEGGQLAGDNGNRETFANTFYTAGATFPASGGGSPSSPATGQYRPKTATDPNGSITAFDYDPAGNVTEVKNQTAAIQASLDYTKAADAPQPTGLLKSATDGNGNTTSYTYDSQGNLLTVKPPLVGSINPGEYVFTYDSEGRIRTRTDERGQILTYAYDRLDRVCTVGTGSQSSLSCTSTPTGSWVRFTYDATGNLTARSASSGTLGSSSSFVYDELNRRTSETFGANTVSYGYDHSSNLKTLTDGGVTTTYGYDSIDRPTSVAYPPAGTLTIGYTDSAAVRSRTVTYPNGAKLETDTTLSGKTKAVRVYASGSSTPLKTLSYDYRRAGTGQPETLLRLAETQKTGTTTDKTTTYAYDTLNRLCWATTKTVSTPSCGTVPAGAGGTTHSYAWDPASNRKWTKTDTSGTVTQTSFGFDAANQLCWTKTGTVTGYACSPIPSGGTAQTRDNAGNNTTGGKSYDAFNRFTGTSGSTLTYAGVDNNELLADGSTALRNSPLGLIASTSGSTTTNYLRLPDGELLGERAGSTMRYRVGDALDSTRWLLNGNSVDKTYDYTPDGTATGTGAGADSLVRFASGHRLNSGMYHFGARYYDPALARWTQRDPLNTPGDLANANAYLYAGADPVNSVDPLGEHPALRAIGRAASAAKSVGQKAWQGANNAAYRWGRYQDEKPGYAEIAKEGVKTVAEEVVKLF